MKLVFVVILLFVYYILLHLWLYVIYKEDSPKFPSCLFYNNKLSAATGCVGIISMALGYSLNDQTDHRLLILYYFGMLMLSVLTVTDIKEKRIPNKVLLVMLGVWTVYIIINMIFDLSSALKLAAMSLSGLVFNGFVFVAGYYLTKKKLGGGDVKLAAVLGLFFTVERSFGILLYGLVLCCLFSVIMLITKKMRSDMQVPLCPFLYLGAIIMLMIN